MKAKGLHELVGKRGISCSLSTHPFPYWKLEKETGVYHPLNSVTPGWVILKHLGVRLLDEG